MIAGRNDMEKLKLQIGKNRMYHHEEWRAVMMAAKSLKKFTKKKRNILTITNIHFI